MLALVADIVRHPSFPETEAETRRGEIVTAIRQDEDSPATMAVESLMGMIYPEGHPYGRRTKGTIATVESITRADLVEYHRTQFSPAGLMVVIVGDVAAARAIAGAERVFGDWHAPDSPSLLLPPLGPPPHRQRLVMPMMSKAQADVAYGFTTVTRRDPDYYALTLMNNVLGQYGLGGRLGDSIRERQGMAYYAFSSFDGNVAEGPLVIRAGVAPENVDRTIASIDEEVRAIVRDGVTPPELADAKRYLIGSMPRNLETNSGIASFLHTAEFFGLGLDYDRRMPALLDAVTLDQVHAATRRVLDPERASIVIAGPYDPGARPATPAPA
jgi:zinc protease